MSDKERLCGEGVGLDFDVCAGDLVDEAGLAHVGKPGDQDGAGVRVDRRKTAQMLPDLIFKKVTLYKLNVNL